MRPCRLAFRAQSPRSESDICQVGFRPRLAGLALVVANLARLTVCQNDGEGEDLSLIHI